MRVALFSNSYLPYLSGITISIKTLKEELEALGHTVFVVGPEYPGHRETDPHILRLPSLPATYPGYRFVFPYSYKHFQRLKQEKIDLIHAQQPFGVGLSALLLARRMQIPLVYSFHTLFSRYIHHASFIPPNISKGFLNAYLAFFCNQVDTVIVPSEMVRRLLVVLGVKKAIRVIPNGVVLRNIRPKMEIRGELRLEIRSKYGIPQDAKLLLCSGRISEEKNIPFLLKAFPLIRKQEKNVFLLVLGGGPKEKDYRKMAAALDQNIVFIGQVPHSELINCCMAADIFVYASLTETQGLVITEAKACGLPVVALFSGALSGIIKSGIDGYLVPRHEEAFTEHVLRLIRDEPLRKEMSLKAQEDSANRFCSSAVAKQIESVYNSLINQKR